MENILTANIDLDQIDQIIANVTKENYVELQKLREKNEGIQGQSRSEDKYRGRREIFNSPRDIQH